MISRVITWGHDADVHTGSQKYHIQRLSCSTNVFAVVHSHWICFLGSDLVDNVGARSQEQISNKDETKQYVKYRDCMHLVVF